SLGALRLQAVDDRLNAWQVGIADLRRDEVDARHQRAAVDPLLAGVPTLDRWWVEQVLSHVRGLHRQLAIARLRQLIATDQTQRADDHFGRRLQVLIAGLLEEGRLEEWPQNRR